MQKFPFNLCLQKAWRLTKSNKLLWVIGVFVGGATMIFDSPSKSWEELRVESVGQVMTNVGNFLSKPLPVFYVLIILILFAAAVLVSFWARAAMLGGVRAANNGEQLHFGTLLKSGLRKVPRILLVEVILGIANLVFGAIIIVSMISGWEKSAALNIIFIAAVAAVIIYNLFLFLFRHYIYCFAVLEDSQAFSAIKQGWRLFRRNAWNLIVVKLIEIGLWAVSGVAALIVLALCVVPFLLLGLILMVIVGTLAWAIAAVLGAIAVFAALLAISGALNTFFQSYLTYVYWETRKDI